MSVSKICNHECYGCSACSKICPVSAIEMKQNEKGFLNPKVSQKCIECKSCIKMCNLKDEFHTVKNAYIAKLKNQKDLLESQSGGAFIAIATQFVDGGGVVYGAVMNENFDIEHIRAENIMELNKIRGSKYAQSRLDNIYDQVKKDLLNNKKVLFSGTPCQISRLYKFLKFKKISLENFFTIDLICHGVPSILIWKDIIKYYERKYKTKIKSAIFRDKKVYKWENPYSTFKIKNQNIKDYYYNKIFGSCLTLRDSCYSCEFAKSERVGDITIGDAWGVKDHNPEFYDENGVSLILVNTDKGKDLTSKLHNIMEIEEVEFEVYKQSNLKMPSKPRRNKEEFWNDYHNKNINFIIKKYAKNNVFYNIKYILKRLRKRTNE